MLGTHVPKSIYSLEHVTTIPVVLSENKCNPSIRNADRSPNLEADNVYYSTYVTDTNKFIFEKCNKKASIQS